MILKRLSSNVSGRMRSQKRGAKVQIRARLMNRLGSKAFFHSRRKVISDSCSSSSDSSSDEEDVHMKSCHTPSSSSTRTTPVVLARKNNKARKALLNRALRVVHPTQTSTLPHPSIRVSYSQPLHKLTQNNTTISDDLNQNETSVSLPLPRVHFQPSVSVVEIPSRDCYTRQDREIIWRSSKEIRFMARRNRKEFSHDGWDWRTATEEDDMIHLGGGDYMHPHSYNMIQGAAAGHHDDEETDSSSDEDPALVCRMSSRELEAKYETTLTNLKKRKQAATSKNNLSNKKRQQMWV